MDSLSGAPIHRDWKWVNIIFLIATFILALIFVPWYLWTHSLTLPMAIAWAISCAMTSMSITTGYHRLSAHRAFEARPWVQALTLFFGAGAFQGSALQWCSDHRNHHRYIDQEADPYNIGKGFWWAHIGWLFFEDLPDQRKPFAPDLEKNKMAYYQHKYYVPLASFVGFILPWGVGWMMGDAAAGLVLLGLGRLVFTQHGTFLINSACHCFGRRPYNDRISARDSLLLALLTYGEGYHNYHHQFQADYRNGVRWYQWDPTKWLITVLHWTGNASKLKRVQASEILKARLQTDEYKLLNRGIPATKIASLKAKVEEAQARVKQLHEEYKKLKASVSESSRLQLLSLKAELRLARIEFRQSVLQWRMYYKIMLSLPEVP